MTLGRSAGQKTCDSCRNEYPGPAYASYRVEDCPVLLARSDAPASSLPAGHAGCTENLCPDCAHAAGINPDRRGDER